MPRSRLARVALAVAGLLFLAVLGLALVARFLLDPAKLRTTLEAQATRAVGQPVRIATARAQLYPRIGLGLTGVTIGDPPAASATRVDVSTGLRPLFSRRVEEADLIVTGGRVDPPRLARVAAPPSSGNSDPAAASGGVVPGGFTIVSVRTVRLEDLEVRGRGDRSVRLDLRASAAGDGLDVPELEIRAGHTRMKGHLKLESLSTRVGTFALDGSMLDLDELAETLAALTPEAAGGSTARSAPAGTKGASSAPLARKLEGTLSVRAARLSGLELADLKANVHVAGSTVTLEPLRASLYDGAYTGSFTLDVSGRAPRVAFRGRLERVDLAALAKAMGSKATPRGRLTASLDVRGAGDDMTQALRTARGTGELRVDDGSIAGLDVAHTALTFLGVGGTPTSGGGFTRLTSHLALGDGRLRTEDLLVSSPDFELRGKGSLDVDGRVDMTADIVLSPALSAAAERSVKELAYAREGDRVVLPVLVTGSVASPSVMVDAAAVAKRAAGQYFEKAKKGLLQRVFGGGK